jgi:molybdenum cofactor cytidylyltransferase
LAAGAGGRMGGRAKCLLEIEGQSLLERLVHAVYKSIKQVPIVVLGHHAAEIQAHFAQWPSHLVPRQLINPSPASDTTSSMHIGLRATNPHVQVVMVLLADQPLINTDDIVAVLDAFQARPDKCRLLVPTVNGVPGHPVIFDSTVRTEMLARPGTSLRHWRAGNPDSTFLWAVNNDNYTRDLDTPDDLIALGNETGWSIKWPQHKRNR